MAWQGIPFPVSRFEEIFNSSYLTHMTIDKLPSVVVESSFSWETLIAAIIAGLIPAAIAYKAIKNNNDLAVFQIRLQSKAKINEEIRMEAAKYVTAVNHLACEYNEWVKHSLKNNISVTVRDNMPVVIQDNIYMAELSKNALILLVKPSAAGGELIERMDKVQDCLSPLLEDNENLNALKNHREAVNNFMSSCHKYFEV